MWSSFLRFVFSFSMTQILPDTDSSRSSRFWEMGGVVCIESAPTDLARGPARSKRGSRSVLIGGI